MKTIHAILALLFATLFVSVFSFADEAKHEVKIKIQQDGDLIDLEAQDMEVGETRQSFSDSGKEILLTRTEEGYDLTVDGKQVDIGMAHGDRHSVFVHSGDSEDAKVMVRKIMVEGKGDGEAHGFHFIHGEEGDEDHGTHHWVQKGDEAHGTHHWVQKGDDSHVFMIERVNPADHLVESGVLDGLDEETRQNILETLREIEPDIQIKKQINVQIHDDIHEEH